jgi:hypothetical protein
MDSESDSCTSRSKNQVCKTLNEVEPEYTYIQRPFKNNKRMLSINLNEHKSALCMKDHPEISLESCTDS